MRRTPLLVDEPLSGLEPPSPPSGLRQRCLDAARAACAAQGAAENGRPDPWAQLWQSRTARLLWAASVLGLVTSHVILSLPDQARGRVVGAPFVIAAAAAEPELDEIIGLRPAAAFRPINLNIDDMADRAGSISSESADTTDNTSARGTGAGASERSL